MTGFAHEPKLVLPFLRRFYDIVIPLSWPVVRVACGTHLVIHGWGKVMRGGAMYSTMWGTLAFAIALRGGGPYSVDRVLGREL